MLVLKQLNGLQHSMAVSCQCRNDITIKGSMSLLCITAIQSIYLMLQLGFWHRDACEHPFSVLYVAAQIDTVSSVTEASVLF